MQRTIAIVGAGFSGAMLTVQLLRQSPDIHIILIGDKGFGRGQAYSTQNPAHLLNVRAKGMSAFPDEPNHFLDWAERRTGARTPDEFIGRALFGAYVREQLAAALRPRANRARVRLVRGHVDKIDATKKGDGTGDSGEASCLLTLRDGRSVKADRIVLATGNFPPSSLAAVDQSALESPVYVGDPWTGDCLRNLRPEQPVLLIGTGLTMVDIVITLLHGGHTGPIHCLSRHGMIPLPHIDRCVPASEPPVESDASLLALFHNLTRQAKRAGQRGQAWQPVVDSIRPATIPFWMGMDQRQRRQFLRHPRRQWEVHRHRMAPSIARQIDAAQQSGQLVLHAGHLQRLTVQDDMATALFITRGDAAERLLTAARVVNCAGPASDFRKLSDPLLRQLLETGKARPDACRLGFDITNDCALIAADGTVSDTLFAIGPMTKAAFWEVVAVPDIRNQCKALAAQLTA